MHLNEKGNERNKLKENFKSLEEESVNERNQHLLHEDTCRHTHTHTHTIMSWKEEESATNTFSAEWWKSMKVIAKLFSAQFRQTVQTSECSNSLRQFRCVRNEIQYELGSLKLVKCLIKVWLRFYPKTTTKKNGRQFKNTCPFIVRKPAFWKSLLITAFLRRTNRNVCGDKKKKKK